MDYNYTKHLVEIFNLDLDIVDFHIDYFCIDLLSQDSTSDIAYIIQYLFISSFAASSSIHLCLCN